MIGISHQYRALDRELRPVPQAQHRSIWSRLVGVFRHFPEIMIVMLLVRLGQITAGQINPVWTSAPLVVSVVGWGGGGAPGTG
jgi:hypothetical protein